MLHHNRVLHISFVQYTVYNHVKYSKLQSNETQISLLQQSQCETTAGQHAVLSEYLQSLAHPSESPWLKADFRGRELQYGMVLMGADQRVAYLQLEWNYSRHHK